MGFSGKMEGDRIEESSVRLLSRPSSGGGVGESRWVDGSEVDSESPPWSLLDENDSREGYGSIRRRLIKKPKRADSFDVEAMEITGAKGHHSKVMLISVIIVFLFQISYFYVLLNISHHLFP